MDLWGTCGGEACIQPIRGTLRRLVESQEQVATSRLVGSLERQALLEGMIEASKPPPRPGTERLHYLLATPFRYPPLRHGSRFGTRAEPSLLYGALSVPTVLAEAAYYRFVFWHGMQVPPPAPLVTQHTLFTARYRTPRGVRLQAPPWDAERERLADPARYADTQALGAAMRDAGVEAFEYPSARDPRRGVNVALLGPAALASTRPSALESWLAETSAERVRFLARTGAGVHEYVLATFLVDGRLPQPAL
ncbi:MAG: RES family NAD+ phosphorylase [Gammaproteobacteria bacterium]|nr:RES family NAD+ phosphorylase [Gammaproteobacteria bacterium]